MSTTSIEGVIAAARPLITQHEGRMMRVYHDSLGIPTIGVGFNLNQAGARQLVANSGADYDALLNGTADLTNEQCDFLLDHCIINTLEWMAGVFPDFFSYSLNRQVALTDMGFNMGQSRFLGFKNMIAKIKAEDWNGAAQEALSSKWASQVHGRADEDASMLSQG